MKEYCYDCVNIRNSTFGFSLLEHDDYGLGFNLVICKKKNLAISEIFLRFKIIFSKYLSLILTSHGLLHFIL